MSYSTDQIKLTESIEWRNIGPFRGGRVVAIAGDPFDPMTFYFGACAGGVWKTNDGGTYWENTSDGFLKTSAIGALSVSNSDPNVIYVGTGEACIRGNVSHGDGVYRSTNKGKTWTHLGLNDTRHIARVRVHPTDPDTVYVAALGHIFGPNQERGIFRSHNGGATWDRILFRNEYAGAADLSMDPNNPRILYASIWEVQRTPWNLSSGGAESSLYKSVDGGDTWIELTNNPGMAKGLKGRMGISVSPAIADRVWAVVEADFDNRGLYRSDNGGTTWERVSGDGNLVQRPWYYSHVFADPNDADTVYVMNMQAWKSTNGGKTFVQLTTPHGDNHEIWIDPNNPLRMAQGNDGGACISFNGGESWSSIFNQPTGQFYHVDTDMQFPYRVYGTQQDNSAVSVPSRSINGAILWGECYPVGSSESGHIAVRQDNPNIVYSGAIGSSAGGGDSLMRYDHATGQSRIVSVWPEFYWGRGPNEHKYRFQWTYPIVISPHDPNILYVAGNMVFRSVDDGESWEVISPDLTRNDVSKMGASGGPITLDTTYVENYGTIFSFAESPHQPGVFWAGSDDGLVHLSKDFGQNWQKVTPVNIPEWTRIDVIEVSPHDPATAYISATRYKHDDLRPFLYKTKNFGHSWDLISNNLPKNDFTKIIRADTERPGLLYVGTESGIYVSFDDGTSWQSLQSNLPIVPVTDLKVKGTELVIATNGRGFWILDDLALIRKIPELKNDVHLFKPAATYRFPPPRPETKSSKQDPSPGKHYSLGLGVAGTFYEKKHSDGRFTKVLLDAGANPPEGVVVHYFIANDLEDNLTLEFRDSKGHILNSYGTQSNDKQPRITIKKGINRFVWDMRYPDARSLDIDGAREKGLRGPIGSPGTYQVRLIIGEEIHSQSFEIKKDPRIEASQADLDAQHLILMEIRDKLSECHEAINRIIRLRNQLNEWSLRCKVHGAPESVSEEADKLNRKLSTIESELIQLKATGNIDLMSQPHGLNAKLAELTFVPSFSDSRPTLQSRNVFTDLGNRTDTQIKLLQQIVDQDFPVFVNLLHELEVPPITPKDIQ